MYALKRMSKLCTVDALKSMYFAYIHSHILFGITLYGSTSLKSLNFILVAQKQAIFIIKNLNKRRDSKKYVSSKLGFI